ncbi:Aste57867_19902 [Aphanomyces stellatus]|uniref:Aste57867_19902 protein n=1 Tax=Aphanomyces stellatus TaxID=120398 RepID=A0A485LEW4_9STRA|nr:hypothetical protein As57867_019836 [Aphanomyces stellatus]VFT96600.1 Aste57867_19902 [Aphanomyces stellatus]
MINGKGTLEVRMDKPYYISGDIITGNLFVDVRQPIECNEVVVFVKGKEKVYWEEEEYVEREGKDDKTIVKRFSNGREFFKQKLVLFNVQHALAPGQYIYPFQYQLPMGLPGCFDNDHDDGVHAKIEYSIKGAIGVQGMFNRDLKKKQTLTVYAQLAGYVAPSFDEKVQSINYLCCFPQGTCTLRVAMDKNMYGPGEVPRIQVDIHNNSKCDVRTMQCKLRRTTIVVGSGKKRTLTKFLTTANFPGVASGQSISQPQSFQLAGKGMFPSTVSSFVTVSYTIDVVCDISLCPDVKLKLPIALGAPALQQPAVVVAAPAVAQQVPQGKYASDV